MKILIGLLIIFFISLLSGIPAFGGIMMIITFCYLLYIIGKNIKRRIVKYSDKKITLEIKDGDNSEEYYTYIAGVNYQCTIKDKGSFIGVVARDTQNKYDKNALAIYNTKGKKLGYIPKDDVNRISEWCKDDNIFCIGYIREGDHADLFGKVKIFSIMDNSAMIEIARYSKWLIENFGTKYAPAELDPVNKLTTSSEWHDFLDEIIAEQKITTNKNR